jgi:hypothetical protein
MSTEQQRTLPVPGKYTARLTGKLVIYQAESGALCVALPIELYEAPVSWRGKETMTIAKSDGEIMTRTVDKLKSIFGWDGIDPFWLEDQSEAGALAECFFEVDGERAMYQPKTKPGEEAPAEVEIFRILYINPLGGGMQMPEPGDRKSILAKFGSKLRAMSGGKAQAPAGKAPAGKAPAGKAAAPATPAKAATPAKGGAPARSGPPSRKAGSSNSVQGRTSSQDEVWQAYEGANAAKEEADRLDPDTLGEAFWAKVDEMFPDAGGELDPKQWGEIANALEV